MSQGFYEQLGVSASASRTAIREAYTRSVAEFLRRRRALLDQGGDTSRIDLARRQADDAWEVLSNPARRRRYDAMRAVLARGPVHGNLWEQASGALVHPAAAAAAELLRVATNLSIGVLPLAPGAAPPADAAPDRLTEIGASGTDTSEEPTEISDQWRAADVVPLPTAAAKRPETTLRVVDGSPGASDVLVLPTRQDPVKEEPSDVASLIRRYGLCGELLRAVRVARSTTIEAMADTTRISARYLQAVEDEDFDVLPSTTFVRGYVREMARFLELDDAALVDGYMARFRR